eukprot:gb/GECH01011764.1/.p1 GENE.gb/GECH01011764.1/~~gb/GECH01011764.1/.p1  ORF type:complete len:244 (+),score=20.61 gb/GECH01011764.1/:1-732(+)
MSSKRLQQYNIVLSPDHSSKIHSYQDYKRTKEEVNELSVDLAESLEGTRKRMEDLALECQDEPDLRVDEVDNNEGDARGEDVVEMILKELRGIKQEMTNMKKEMRYHSGRIASEIGGLSMGIQKSCTLNIKETRKQLWSTERRLTRTEALNNNYKFPFQLAEVPNQEGFLPSESGLQAIDGFEMISKFDTKGDKLNQYLHFYGYNEGKGQDFDRNGNMFHRKFLLCCSLGIDTKLLSHSKLQR